MVVVVVVKFGHSSFWSRRDRALLFSQAFLTHMIINYHIINYHITLISCKPLLCQWKRNETKNVEREGNRKICKRKRIVAQKKEGKMMMRERIVMRVANSC